MQYKDAYRLCYIRGPEGLLIGLAQELIQALLRDRCANDALIVRDWRLTDLPVPLLPRPLVRARRWLYEHRLLIVHNRAIRTLIAAALTQFEAAMSAAICTVVQQEHVSVGTRLSPSLF